VASKTDEALLRRFEPVARYTQGDRFFPMDAESYVRACSLWVGRPGEDDVCLVPHGKLTLDLLPNRDATSSVPCTTSGSLTRRSSRTRSARMRVAAASHAGTFVPGGVVWLGSVTSPAFRILSSR
jgi:hypothetical protein